jgi:hypothetical protein
MFRSLLLACIALAVLSVAACGGVATRNQEAHAKFVAMVDKRDAAQRQAEAEATAKRATDYAAIAAKCTDSACVQSVAAFKAITDAVHDAMAGSRAGSAASIPAPPYERDAAAKFRDIVSGATPLLGTVASAWVNVRQSDNAVRTSEAQYEFLGSAVTGMADVARDAQPNVTVGGDYVTGTQHIGDAITGDGNATRDSQVGDNAGRDMTGRDHIDIADSTIDSFNGDDRDNCTAGDGADGGNGGTGAGSGGASGGGGGACGG